MTGATDRNAKRIGIYLAIVVRALETPVCHGSGICLFIFDTFPDDK